MRLGLIGNGAIAQYAKAELEKRGHVIAAYLLRPERVAAMPAKDCEGLVITDNVAGMPRDLDHVIDCAGHVALRQYGADLLRRGHDRTTVSIGSNT